MTDSPKSDLRFIYISDDVWLNLKKQAVLEGNSVSKIVRTVIEAYFENPFNVNLPERRGLGEDSDMYSTRGVYIPLELWNQLISWSKGRKKASKSGLIQLLISKYLGDPVPFQGNNSSDFQFTSPKDGFFIDLDKRPGNNSDT